MSDRINGDGPVTYSGLPPNQMVQGEDLGTQGKDDWGAGGVNTDYQTGNTGQTGTDSGTPVLPLPDLDPASMSLLLAQIQSKLSDDNITSLGSGVNARKTEIDKALALKLQNIEDYYKKLEAQHSETSGFFSGLFNTIRDIFSNPKKGWQEFGEMWKNHGITLIITLSLPWTGLGLFMAPYYIQQFFADPKITEWLAKSGVASKVEDLLTPYLTHDQRIETLKSLKKWLKTGEGHTILKAICGSLLGDTSVIDDDAYRDKINKIPAPPTKYMFQLMGKITGSPITTDDLLDMTDAYIDKLGTKEGDAMLLSLTVSGYETLVTASTQIVLTIAADFIPPPMLWGTALAVVFFAVDATTAAMDTESGVHQLLAAKDGSDAAKLSAKGDQLKAETDKMRKQMALSMDNMKNSIETAQYFINETMDIMYSQALSRKAATQI